MHGLLAYFSSIDSSIKNNEIFTSDGSFGMMDTKVEEISTNQYGLWQHMLIEFMNEKQFDKYEWHPVH